MTHTAHMGGRSNAHWCLPSEAVDTSTPRPRSLCPLSPTTMKRFHRRLIDIDSRHPVTAHRSTDKLRAVNQQ